MAHEHQERYSELTLVKMRAELALKDGVVFNNDYEGDWTIVNKVDRKIKKAIQIGQEPKGY